MWIQLKRRRGAVLPFIESLEGRKLLSAEQLPGLLVGDSASDVSALVVDDSGHLSSFTRDGAAWTALMLDDQALAGAGTGTLATWTDPRDNMDYAALINSDGDLIQYRRTGSTWERLNVSDQTPGAPILSRGLTAFTSNNGLPHLAAISSTDELILFAQPVTESPGSEYVVRNLSSEIAANGVAVPSFVSPLVSYVTTWNGMNVAGLTSEGTVWSVWTSPELGTWTASNLSEITGAPAFVGQVTAYLTSWGGINLAGVNEQGDLSVTWWIPEFCGEWRTNNLSEQFAGPWLSPNSITSYVTPWGGLNIAGLDLNGEVTVYWWSPGLEVWVISPLAGGEALGSSDIFGPISSHAAPDGSLHLVGRSTEPGEPTADVFRLSWSASAPSDPWQLDIIGTVSESRGLRIGDPGQQSLELTSHDPHSFVAPGPELVFKPTESSLSTDPLATLVRVNGQLVSDSNVEVTPQSIRLQVELAEGLNDIEIYHSPELGLDAIGRFEIWSGSETLEVHVLDPQGQPAIDQSVSLALGDNNDVGQIVSTDGAGVATFVDLPDRTVIIEAMDEDGALGVAGVAGGDGTVDLEMIGFNEPVETSNHNFENGLDGWEVGSAPVSLTPEGVVNGTAPGDFAAASMTASAQDLTLETSGEGPETISYTFTAVGDSSVVSVRFRFITSEFPGGYYGTQYNDFYSVRLRSESGAGVAADSRSMNTFPESAFDPSSGSLDWRELTLTLSQPGDTVQLDVTVANVGDGLFDSQVVVDGVEEQKLLVKSVDLIEPVFPNSSSTSLTARPLTYLSASPHQHGSPAVNATSPSNTVVHGKLRIEGDQNDSIAKLELLVKSGTTTVAKGTLHSAAAATLLNQNFGASGAIEITTTTPLFEIDSSQFNSLTISNGMRFSLIVSVESMSGQTTDYNAGSAIALVNYPTLLAADRFGTIGDPNAGGDGWGVPRVIEALNHFRTSYGIRVNDISNMNGGPFAPHKGHQDGTGADILLSGTAYLTGTKTKLHATELLKLLNDPTYGKTIRQVGTTYTPGDAFHRELTGKTLADGRSALSVVKNWTQHGHFHVDFF